MQRDERTVGRRAPASGRRIALVAASGGLVAGLLVAACFGVAARPSSQADGRASGATAAKAGGGNADATAAARGLGDAFVSVAEQVSRSVVSIRVEQVQRLPRMPAPFFGPFGAPFGPPPRGGDRYGVRRGAGSGVIIRPDGYIVTNRHVVADADNVEVLLHDERRFEGKVVGTDEATDLAVVKIDATGLPAARFADSDAVRVGQWVLAIGSPFGLDYTVTAGVVSAKGRALGANEIEDYIQTDASINPGNSGGPLVDLEGRVVGINTMIVGRASGIGFAVPSNFARQVADQLIEHGAVERAWIGVVFQDVTPELASQFGLPDADGALVAEVTPDGPAAKAGVRPGDVIVAVDGRPVREGRDLLRYVLRKRVGEKVTLDVYRDGRRQQLELTTGRRPGSRRLQASVEPLGGGADLGSFGLELRKLTPELRQRLHVEAEQGVVVVRVRPGSAADRAGLRPGDLLLEADRKPVAEVRDVQKALSDGQALLRVRRRGGSLFLVLRK